MNANRELIVNFGEDNLFVVISRRSSMSVFGSAEAPVRGLDGEIEYYETMDEACAAAERYNAQTRSPNVFFFGSNS